MFLKIKMKFSCKKTKKGSSLLHLNPYSWSKKCFQGCSTASSCQFHCARKVATIIHDTNYCPQEWEAKSCSRCKWRCFHYWWNFRDPFSSVTAPRVYHQITGEWFTNSIFSEKLLKVD
ncbi:uncharacterized protein LOC114179850 [Vigna unguiculata]|uniref:uncharacterized protein LOC114179850 n=1 Tax=Vigna unguiculata TaxID=3917 RepID=UPI001015D2C6|nr:uncharacterized protein LOC114179850 [Vigna unguiculata]XP_027922131.1 uncharacterized protein LOC114179850 [Vigna unguiculata]